MQEDSPESIKVVEAECVHLHEGSMCIAVSARRCRSARVEDWITYERSASEPRRPGRVRRTQVRRGRYARENRSVVLS